ncbi:MAG: EAL domain-containing protein [Nitrosospira sp.]|nr:EAL domain-containing protein [Nitrosospira sp.]
MILDLTQNLPSMPQGQDFFLARQPILDRDQSLIAYELLFRRAETGPANVINDLRGTASLIAHASELGIGNAIGSALGFVNVDAAMLMSDLVNFLPCDKVVLEILETVEATPELIRRVSELMNAGYAFALDDVMTLSDDIEKLLPLVKIIKIDISGMTQPDLAMLVSQFKQAKKLLLAEKVETIEQFRSCRDLGFDYYQGYYFAKPVILSGKKLSTSQLAIMQLMTLLAKDTDNAEIENSIKKEASLVLSLLRLVNTVGMGVTKRMDSLAQALMVLGRDRLQQWLQVLLYTDSRKDNRFASPLLLLATTRGKFLELIAGKLEPADKSIADAAFTVGLISLLDALLGQPMRDILERIVVGKDVSEALLYRQGFYGDLLKLSEYVERPDEAGQLLAPLLLKLQLSTEDLYLLQLEAFGWSNNLSSLVH